MNPNEIEKALECRVNCNSNDCSECPYRIGEYLCDVVTSAKDTLAYINQLESERDDLYFKLVGVMHFVDKWLDDDQLNQHEVNRAETMREKTLQIVEKLQAEVERLNNGLAISKKETKRYFQSYTTAKSDAVKEFWEELKKHAYTRTGQFVMVEDGDNLVKEMVGDEE